MAVSVSDLEVFELAGYFVPSITVYNRLEPTPRTVDFDRSLRAEVRDAMWMLTRQWQFGEFKGEDAATAVTTKILGEHTNINTVHFNGDNKLAYDGSIPLETVVERELIARSLGIAVQMARYFIKLMKSHSNFENRLNQLLIAYPLNYTVNINDTEGQQLLNTLKGKIFDGFSFYESIIDDTVPNDIKTVHVTEIEEFKNWYRRNYNQPESTTGKSWKPSQLEYQFAVSCSSQETTLKKLNADHYPGGHLDWYSFDINLPLTPTSSPVPNDLVTEKVQSYIPVPLTFRGMPHPRFWTMEERVTDFGKIDTTPTGLLHLLLAEFGLTCSNDWFILPYQLAINTFCEIKGILVKDVFGEYTVIRPAGAGTGNQWQRWAMFHHTMSGSAANLNSNSFYLVPSMNKSLEGPRLEQINFLRDEMANMVWAVENIVPSQAGNGIRGDEMALPEDDNGSTAAAGANTNGATIRYVLGTTVPRNWIPFIPRQIRNNSPEIQFQRAQFPGTTGALGVILKEKEPPYFIDEEILGSSGLLVSRSFQSTRFINGSSWLWIGRKKETGKGEGWSNLKFDQTEYIP
jgi:hypothetical protein